MELSTAVGLWADKWMVATDKTNVRNNQCRAWRKRVLPRMKFAVYILGTANTQDNKGSTGELR